MQFLMGRLQEPPNASFGTGPTGWKTPTPRQLTYVYDDVEGIVVGEEDTDAASVLHDSVIVEGQFAHRVPGPPCGLLSELLQGRGGTSGSEHSPSSPTAGGTSQHLSRQVP